MVPIWAGGEWGSSVLGLEDVPGSARNRKEMTRRGRACGCETAWGVLAYRLVFLQVKWSRGNGGGEIKLEGERIRQGGAGAGFRVRHMDFLLEVKDPHGRKGCWQLFAAGTGSSGCGSQSMAAS